MENIVYINDFEFIIGLDGFYRKNMMKYESKKLLPLLNKMVNKLNINLKNVVIEGYYYETEELKKYFTIVQNLKNIEIEKIEIFKKHEGYNKLIELFCSGLYGEYLYEKNIIPIVNDNLNKTLIKINKIQYNYKNILDYAYEEIKDKEILTLVEMGILTKNPIIVTALRESVALYVEPVMLGIFEPPKNKYIWNVNKNIEKAGNKIIEMFNNICPYKIPVGIKENAELFYDEFIENNICYRCIKIVTDENGLNYHWAIIGDEYNKKYEFKEFWDKKLWSTEEFKKNYKKGAYFA